MKHFHSLLLGALLVFAPCAASAQEIASKPRPTSFVVPVSTKNAEVIEDEAFNAELRSQLQSVLAEATKDLAWKAQLIAPETLGWEISAPNAGSLVAHFQKELGASNYTVRFDDLGTHDGSKIKLLSATKPGAMLLGVMIIGADATFLSWGFAAPQNKAGGEVLVEGTPSLTTGMVSQYTDFLIWLWNEPRLSKAKDDLMKLTAVYLADQWKNNRASAMNGTFTILHNFAGRNSLSKSESEGARAWLSHNLRLAAYNANNADVAAESIMQVYELIDPTLAKSKTGAPPLSTRTRDAYTNMMAFMMGEIEGGVTLSADEKKALGEWLVGAFPSWSVEEQTKVAQAPVAWVALQQEWPTLGASEKSKMKASWKAALGPAAQGFQQQRAKLVAAQKEAAAAKAEAEKSSEKTVKASGKKYDSDAFTKAMNKANASHRSYQMLSNMMWQSHYTRMNSIASWGGSSYRYVNQWGTPY